MALKAYYYKVADIPFAVNMDESRDAAALLPSFAGFETDALDAPAFEIDAESKVKLPGKAEIIAKDENDMGLARVYACGSDGYCISLTYSGCENLVQISKDWTKSRAMIDWNSETAGSSLSSILRMQFAQVALAYDAISLHASAVVKDGKGYLFMGKSGMGKSTHSQEWLKAFPEAALLNDDNPAIRIAGNKLMVYGTPWSGKTPCYRNESCPVGGIARIYQKPFNVYTPLEDVNAFVEVYKGCSVLRTEPSFHDRLCDVLMTAVEMTSVGRMECLPDVDAAKVCYDGFNEK